MVPSLPDPVEQTLEIRGLSIAFSTPRGHARVVDDVSLSIGAGEIVGVIGESGSGGTISVPQVRIKDVAQSVAEEIEPENA